MFRGNAYAEAIFRRSYPSGRALFMSLILMICWFLMTGCAVHLKSTPEDARLMPDRKYDKATISSRIGGVYLKTSTQNPESSMNRLLLFDKSGGLLNIEDSIVYGTTESAKNVTFRFDELMYIRFVGIELAPLYMIVDQLVPAVEKIEQNPCLKIKRGESPCYNVITFNKSGGLIDNANGYLVGTTESGTPVSISLDRVYCLHSHINKSLNPFKKINYGKTLPWVATAAAAVVVTKGVFDVISPD